MDGESFAEDAERHLELHLSHFTFNVLTLVRRSTGSRQAEDPPTPRLRRAGAERHLELHSYISRLPSYLFVHERHLYCFLTVHIMLVSAS